MRESSRHTPGSVMLGESIGSQNIRKALVSRREGVWIIGAFFLVHCRISLLLGIQGIAHWRLKRLVVGGKWTIFQSAAYVNPTRAIWMQDERLVASQSLSTGFLFQVTLVTRRLFQIEVWRVATRPFFLFFVPPD